MLCLCRYIEGTTGVIPTMVLKELENAVKEGFLINAEIEKREFDEYREEGLPCVIDLYRRLDTLKYRYTMLKNPVLR